MIISRLIKASAVLSLLLFSILVSAQETIYVESFNEEGAGIAGPCTTAMPNSCFEFNAPTNGQWFITGDATALDGANGSDLFQVNDNGELVARDVDEELCILTQEIDISGFEDILIEVTLREEGDLETDDYIDVTYIVDEAPVLIQDFNGQGSSTHTLIGVTGREDENPDWNSVFIEQMIQEGSLLQIEICFRNNPGTELYFLDEIAVLGTAKEVIPVDPIPTMSQWALFILALIFSSIGVLYLGKTPLEEAPEYIK